MTARLSLGIAAAAGPAVAAELAPTAEQAGLHALWVNDTPGHDALEVLAAAADATERLVLATGVLPLDRRSPAEIRDRVAELGLPEERLVLGIGSGAGAVGALGRVKSGAGVLRPEPTDDADGSEGPRVVVGALGPKMRRLGATASDGLLLSWLTPPQARAQGDEAHQVAPSAHVALYVRAATDAAAAGRLDAETERYAGYPAYAANFARLGIAARDTVIRPDAVDEGIAAYRAAVDEVVLRAITADETLDHYLRFIDAVAAAAAA
jgi:alkanesulfonate monooxygenase SsuD/methylene tetrahydromethanopterin reductase-like flavin-dependent oxidoreductase (luciferase family)